VAAYNRRKLTEHKRTNKSGSFTGVKLHLLLRSFVYKIQIISSIFKIYTWSV